MVQHEINVRLFFLWLIKRNMGGPSVTLSEKVSRTIGTNPERCGHLTRIFLGGWLHFQFVDRIFVGKTIGKPQFAMSIGPWPLEFHVEQWLFCNLGTGGRTRHVKLVAPA